MGPSATPNAVWRDSALSVLLVLLFCDMFASTSWRKVLLFFVLLFCDGFASMSWRKVREPSLSENSRAFTASSPSQLRDSALSSGLGIFSRAVGESTPRRAYKN